MSKKYCASILHRRSFGENNINAGRLKEFPSISIDKFFGDDLKATIFILTHCHTDHMVGLDEEEFWERLNEPNIRLYVSEITPLLIPLFKRYLNGKTGVESLINNGKIVKLPVCSPINIEDPATEAIIKLTCLPAGHCPGSIMLQFEFDDQCVLYTGDCRIGVADLKKLDSLHNKTKDAGKIISVPKPMTHLYIDTTFCSSRSQHFPGRVDALDELVLVIRKWFAKNSHNCVNLSFSANFAHEYVLLRFRKEFGIQCHVNQERFDAYREIPSLSNAVTLNPRNRFHLCENDSACLINFTSGTTGQVLKLRLSSLWFMKNENGTGPTSAIKYDKARKTITICYAMHSSLEEISEMIRYLKPKVVTPLVLPQGMPRSQLEEELKRSARCSYIYEDYINGQDSPSILPVKLPHCIDTGSLGHSTSSTEPVTPSKKQKIKWDYPWTP